MAAVQGKFEEDATPFRHFKIEEKAELFGNHTDMHFIVFTIAQKSFKNV